MASLTPEEIYQKLLAADVVPEVQPIIDALRAAGGFSSQATSLIRRMQKDESFRQSWNGSMFKELGRSYGLSWEETFGLLAASMMLHPKTPWTGERIRVGS